LSGLANAGITLTGNYRIFLQWGTFYFEDIYNADKAGTLNLKVRSVVNSTDSSAVNNTYPLSPADYVVLGGDKHDLYLSITNFNATSATVKLIGTDINDTNQTEEINITGDGTYYATKLFKTLNKTQVTAFSGASGTSFDYTLTQGQWGVVSKLGEASYLIESDLYIYNGAHLITENEQIQIGTPSQYREFFLNSANGCYLRMGKKDADGYGINGSFLRWYANKGIYHRFSGKFYCYGSHFWRRDKGSGYTDNYISGYVDIVDSTFDTQSYFYFEVHSSGTVTRSTFKSDNNLLYVYTQWITWDTLKLPEGQHILFGRSMKLNDVDFGTDKGLYPSSSNYIATLTDCIWNTSNVFGSSSGHIYKKYHVNLDVIDKDNNPIPNASVKIWANNGTLVANTTTDSNGESSSLITSYYLRWYLGRRSTEIDYNPFKIKISKQNYSSVEFNFTIDKKAEWIISLGNKWNFTKKKLIRIVNSSGTTVMKITKDGDLAVAGDFYENRNSAPPEKIVWSLFNLIWLTDKGDLYLKGYKVANIT